MSDLRELYQGLILDHNRKPRHFGTLPAPTHQADGYNPLCGDRFTVHLQLDDANNIADIAFSGSGCAISKASASLMTTQVKGKSAAHARSLFASFHAMVTDEDLTTTGEGLGKLAVFAGVKEYPARVKCATLSWHTLAAALDGTTETAITE